jgi:raffinose/stachyose/melibiose transport system substrate-binding protein
MQRNTIVAVVLALIIGLATGAVIGYSVIPRPAQTVTPTTLQIWTPFAGEEGEVDFWGNLSNAFQNMTGVSLSLTQYSGDTYFTKIASSFAAGAAPDIYVTYGAGDLASYVAAHEAENLTSLLNEDWARGQITPAQMAPGTINGTKYALPLEFDSDWLFINAYLFNEYNIPIPSSTGNWTWNQFISACQILKAHGVAPVTIDGADTWETDLLTNYFIERVNGPNAFMDAYARQQSFVPIMNKTYTAIQQFVNSGYLQYGWQTMQYMDAWSAFTSGKAAMWLQGSWIVGISPDTTNFTLAAAPFPYFPQISNKTSWNNWLDGGPTMLAISPQTKHLADAEALFRLISTPEWLDRYIELVGTSIAQQTVMPPGLFAPAMVEVMNGMSSAPEMVIRFGSQVSPTFGGTFTTEDSEVWAQTTTPSAAAQALEAEATTLFGPVK